jgi:RNA polymerase sigma-70 factor, ECF subfamily
VACNSGRLVGHDVAVDELERRRLRVLYADHADAVHAYARRRTDAATAEDVVMEVFVVACRRLDRVPQDALPWLLAGARRVLANKRRGAARMQALVDRLARSATVGSAGSGDAMDLVGIGLGELSERDREVLLLSAWEDLQPSQIATVLGCSRTAAAVRLHRARKRLATAIAEARNASSNAPIVEVIQ